MAHLHFFKAALRDYRIGALTKSSPFVVNRIASFLPPDPRCIVEYGAGDGIVTKKLLQVLSPDGQLLAIEFNDDLLRGLKSIPDPRLRVIEHDVANVISSRTQFSVPPAHAVVSGIPFSFFSSHRREEIVRDTFSLLTPGGVFVLYQYSFLMLPVLKNVFGSAHLAFEPRNFPPYFIMVARKES